MAIKLSAFKTNSKAINEGAWVALGDEYPNVEILTRGFTDAYNDARGAMVRRAAVQFGGDAAKIPSATLRGFTTECMIACMVLGVRGLDAEDGTPMTLDAFKDALRDPDYADLVLACIKAASVVGFVKAADLADALPNSPTPSA